MLIATIEPNVHYTHAQVRLWDTTAPGNVPRATLEAQYHDLHRVFEQWARIYQEPIFNLQHHGFTVLATKP